MNTIKKMIAGIRGGVNVPHLKNTADGESVRMPTPPLVILPMRQHIGEPCKPVVKTGDEVAIGQIVGDTDALLSAPIHATVSGTVKAVYPCSLPDGSRVDAVHIENDGMDTMHPQIKKPEVKNREDFLRAVRQSGVVGMGGAGFPTHAKLTLKDGCGIDTLVINGAECEPYITADYREIMENRDDVLSGIERVMGYLEVDRCIIGIEENKPMAITLLKDEIIALNMRHRVCVANLPARYPYGAEKIIVKAVTGRTIPLGKLPCDVGVIAMNISTVAALSRYMDTGIPLIQRRITVAGGAIAKPRNVLVPIGATINDIVDFCGGYIHKPERVITGGPMMGITRHGDPVPITKTDNAILCLTAKETYSPQAQPCIRCGRCVKACPMSLMPNFIERYANCGNAKMLKKLSVSGCMECGSCAYACPAKRLLVQSMRRGKQTIGKGDR